MQHDWRSKWHRTRTHDMLHEKGLISFFAYSPDYHGDFHNDNSKQKHFFLLYEAIWWFSFSFLPSGWWNCKRIMALVGNVHQYDFYTIQTICVTQSIYNFKPPFNALWHWSCSCWVQLNCCYLLLLILIQCRKMYFPFFKNGRRKGTEDVCDHALVQRNQFISQKSKKRS